MTQVFGENSAIMTGLRDKSVGETFREKSHDTCVNGNYYAYKSADNTNMEYSVRSFSIVSNAHPSYISTLVSVNQRVFA